MKPISKKEILDKSEFYVEEIIDGKIFAYSMNEFYVLGCDARNAESVHTICKVLPNIPLSIIAPNREWIDANFRVNDESRKTLKKLPSQDVILLEIKRDVIVKEILQENKAGITIPDHWFAKIIERAWAPFVIARMDSVNSFEIPKELEKHIEYIIK